MSEPSPDDASLDHERLADLADDFARRYRRGERPAVEEYAQQHPALAAQIRELFPAMLVMEQSSEAAAPQVAPASERVGAVVGRYKLLERLGEGGFGTVFMAEQQHPVRRKVAIKLLKAGMDSRQVIARFEAERQALALMDHENIAKVFDAGAADGGRPYFVMELVHGVPITQFCDRHQLAPRERLGLFVQVCRAVQHAHQKGVIHRDIKPNNVLVTLHDGVAVAKVIDFGVAKATGQQPLTERTLFTQFAQMVGTPLYMSPEQAEMSGLDVDTRSDVYSLGVLLYELLTGTTPFDVNRLRKAAYDEVRRIICEEVPPRPSTRISTLGDQLATVSANRKTDARRLGYLVRGELDWIVMRALEKDRTRRYDAASSLARDVERYLAGEPVQACPPSRWYRFRTFARRNKRALMIVALLAAMLLGTVVVQAVNNRRIRREQARTLAALSDARTSRDRAREVLDQMSSRVIDDWLSRQPKLTTEQRQFLEFALARYEELAQESGDTPAQRLALALANRRVGELRSRLGHSSDAGAALARAMTLLDALARAQPEVPEYAVQRATTHTSLGHAHGNVGRPAEALAAYIAAQDLMRQLVDAHPAVTGYAAGLAGADNNVALVQTELGRPEEARHSYASARDLLARLLREAPGDPKYANALATTLTNLAVVQAQLNQPSEAARSCEDALVLAEPLVAAHPEMTEYRETLARAHNHLGNFRAGAGQADEALKSLEAARALREQLVRDFPGVPQYAVDLGGTCCNIGHLLRYTDQPDAALAPYDVAVANLQRAYQQEPRFDEAAAFLINTYGGQAAALARLGRREEELKAYASMCGVKERRLRERGATPELAVDLAMSHTQVGLLHIALGRRDEALASVEAARGVLAGASPDDDGRPDVLVNLGGTYCNMGVLLQRCDDPQTSLAWFGKALATLEPVNRADSAGGNSGPFLVNCHAGRAHALGKLDRPAEALEDWDRAIALAKAPNPSHRLERARTLLRLGDHARAAAAAGELAEAGGATPTVVYNAARVCSLCVPLAEQDASLVPPERERLADAYALRSVDLLRRAVRGGFKGADRLPDDADLNPLRRRADFQTVLTEVEAKANQPAPTTKAAAPQARRTPATTYEQLLTLAAEVYAPGELEMVHYRLKYASAVGNAGRFDEAERLIVEAVADAKAYGSFGPWIDVDACERLVYLYPISGQSKKGEALTPRLAELQRQLSITPYVRPPLRTSTQPSTLPHLSPPES